MPDVIKLTSRFPGSICGGIMRDGCGKSMLNRYGVPVKARITVEPETILVQESEDHAPEAYVKLRMDFEGATPYHVRMRISDFNDTKRFEQAMKDNRLPEGIEFSDAAALRNGIIALSFVKEIFPEHPTDFYADADGLHANGRRLANIRFCIAGETTNEYNEKAYILRTEDGKRVTVDAAEMPLGRFAWRLGQNAQIYDSVALYLYLTRQWAATSEDDRRAFELEPIRQQQAELAAKAKEEERRARWRIK